MRMYGRVIVGFNVIVFDCDSSTVFVNPCMYALKPVSPFFLTHLFSIPGSSSLSYNAPTHADPSPRLASKEGRHTHTHTHTHNHAHTHKFTPSTLPADSPAACKRSSFSSTQPHYLLLRGRPHWKQEDRNRCNLIEIVIK